jgi:hypothetical protein
MRVTGIELGLAAALLLVGALTLMQLTNIIWGTWSRTTVTILGCSSALTGPLTLRPSNAVAWRFRVRGRMLRVIFKLWQNEGRFTATEYGILAGLTVIAVERLATTF